ncbi:MAG: hypothetical protein EXR68_03505, partial [Dehalococcoidia bacterium]|nr:hypothetical protein [Dehalococcoidia bacterium]
MGARQKRLSWAVGGGGAAIAALAIAGMALGQTSSRWDLSQSGVTAGGGTSGGISEDDHAYVVLGSIGEPMAGTTLNGTPYSVTSGILAADRALFRLLVILAAK